MIQIVAFMFGILAGVFLSEGLRLLRKGDPFPKGVEE